MTASEALKLSNQDFEVVKEKTYVSINDQLIDSSHFATVRTDTNEVLGAVGERYNILQNQDAFKFFDSIVDRQEAIYETAGVLSKGETTWIAAKLPEHITVLKGDDVELYIVLWNSHDGRTAAEAIATPVRIVCNNTLNAARKKYVNKIKIRHTASMDQKIQDASNLLGIVDNLKANLQATYKELAKIKVSDEEIQKFLLKHFATDQEFKSIIVDEVPADDVLSTRKQNIITQAYTGYFEGVGQDKIVGTAWGAYNALTHYYSHEKSYHNDDNRMQELVQSDKVALLDSTIAFFSN